jgi:hypothetical protein
VGNHIFYISSITLNFLQIKGCCGCYVCAPTGIRTQTEAILSRLPLPVGLWGLSCTIVYVVVSRAGIVVAAGVSLSSLGLRGLRGVGFFFAAVGVGTV